LNNGSEEGGILVSATMSRMDGSFTGAEVSAASWLVITGGARILRDIAVDMPAISASVERLARRMKALEKRGVDVEALDFEASYGRTSMEYYDGFVFGFHAASRPDLPAVATGGRYDALCRVLGQGRDIPAVGGVIRPDLLIALEADQ
ncbi:MAG: ATP phosphoribosyltransferase regulatory subunit, partial [Pseudomonadota bacterium]|nr:ATP phosphoribosyltransferase regulatory subunit [Pseudomonadota bacterium]